MQQRGGFPDTEELGTKELVFGEKKFYIDAKSNEQGQFMRIVETQTSGRGRITLDWDKAHELCEVIDDYLKEIAKLGGLPQDEEDQKQVKSAAIRQGKRRYFVDLRENTRGRFVKITQFSGPNKLFVFISAENLQEFRDAFSDLLEKHNSTNPPPTSTTTTKPAQVQSVGTASGTGRSSSGNQVSDASLPEAREVRAGGKRFYFDVLQNDRGVFLKLSEVQTRGRVHVNIPHSCWSKMAEVFQQISVELPFPGATSVAESDSTGE